jgi:protein SCO1/2
MSEASTRANRRNALRLALALIVLVGGTIFLIAGMESPKSVDTTWFGKSLEPLRPAYPFELTDQNGNPFRLADQRGNLVLLNFGFTCCPNICPASLANLAAARRTLPEEAKNRVSVVFVSVDERDDISALKKYMPMFDEKFTGLTGSPEAVGNTARAYGAFYRKDPKGPQGKDDISHRPLDQHLPDRSRWKLAIGLHDGPTCQRGGGGRRYAARAGCFRKELIDHREDEMARMENFSPIQLGTSLRTGFLGMRTFSELNHRHDSTDWTGHFCDPLHSLPPSGRRGNPGKLPAFSGFAPTGWALGCADPSSVARPARTSGARWADLQRDHALMACGFER